MNFGFWHLDLLSMVALIQRVTKAKVMIKNQVYSQTNHGYVIFLGIYKDDTEKDIEILVEKTVNLRIMSDGQKKMNRSILEIGGEILVVSQFTLCANLKGGRRPDFFPAKEAKEAEKLYELFIKKLREKNISVKTGQFGAYMEVQLINDGPVTIIIDSQKI